MEVKLSYKEAEKLIIDLFLSYGCDLKGACSLANNFLLTEGSGVTTHGFVMLPAHIKKIVNGEYNLNVECIVQRHTAALTLVDCNNAIGMLSAEECMQIAIERAKQYGLHAVFCNNCNTYGAAFVYPYQATKQGLIGFTMSNSPAQMAPLGGMSKLLGTNPLAYGIPAHKENPIIFDMSTSIVAKSKINEAYNHGEKIPGNWALDINGHPTTDAYEAIKGFILPMAGAKGYGLSMMIDLIAGLLSHAKYLDNVGRFYGADKNGMNVGHFFLAIDPNILYGKSFYKEIDKYIKKVHFSKSLSDMMVKIPGDNKMNLYTKSVSDGFVIPSEIYKTIKLLIKA